MSYKRSVFYSLGRPAPKTVPLDVIARIGYNHIVPEEKPKEEATKSDSQTDINKLTQAITDAISNAVSKQTTPTDPEGGQQNNAGLEDLEKLVVNNDKGVVEPLSPSYEEAVENDEENLKNLDPDLYNYIRERDENIPIIRVDNPADAARSTPLQGKVVICTTSFNSGEVRYKVYTKSSTTTGAVNTDFEGFKRSVADYNKKILDGETVSGTTAVARFVK